MPRSRKPEDPEKYPVPCCRCGSHYQVAARWPDGSICGYCYVQAKRTTGQCACGHNGVLPGMIDDRPACRKCSGVKLNVDCAECGAEAELYAQGRCWTCTLNRAVDRSLTNFETGEMSPQLSTLATALKSMRRSNSGLTWIRQKHVAAFLDELRTFPTVDHEALDGFPASRTREHVRELLVTHGALAPRPEYIAKFEKWSSDALARVATPAHREIATRYVRWHHLRRMHSLEEAHVGTFLRSKQTVTVAIDFLNWLSDRGVTIDDLQQSDLDLWQADGTTTREIASRFLQWLKKNKLAPKDLTMTPHRRGTSPKLDADGQQDAIDRVTTEAIEPREKCAAILVLVFAQPISRVARLLWRDVTISDELVTVQLGSIAIALPPPLDEPWRALATSLQNRQTAAQPHAHWVFPGRKPGQPINPGHLRQRLRGIFEARAARLGTIHELTKLAPVAILADTLGYAPSTVELHAIASTAQYAEYMGTVSELGPGTSV